MRKFVTIIYSVVAAMFLMGCGGVDLAMKKGDKLYALCEY